jgi:UDP-glucose:(heptosyl)LPS alpha-1,3-glucosyltransferase
MGDALDIVRVVAGHAGSGMKAAFCVFNQIRYGGMPRNLYRIAGAWLARGHALDIYAQKWEGPIPEGAKLIEMPARGFTNHQHNRAFHRRVTAALARERYDVVVGFNKMPGLDVYYAADACFKARSLEDRPWLYRLTPRYRQSEAFERAVFDPTATTHILVLAENEQRKYMRYYGTQPERFHLLPPIINRDAFAPDDYPAARAQAREALALGDDEKLVLLVGSGFRAKGVDRAVRAMAGLPHALKARARLLVIGQDNPTRYQALARRLGVASRIVFAGGRDDVPLHLLAADVLLHPAYHETTGNVLLEALSAGLPVLTTDACGYAVHVERAGGGEVIPAPFSQQLLDERLAYMLDATRRAVWSAQGIAYMKRFVVPDRVQLAVDIVERHARHRIAAAAQ